MAAAFADIEQDIATASMGLLANAVARTANGSEIDVIFDLLPVDAIGGAIDGSGPSMRALDSDVAGLNLAHGTIVTIRGVGYKVSNPRPDGTGWTTLLLEPL
jgi:hypothetical protein